MYVRDLDSSIWEVSTAALNAVASDRISELSKPKVNSKGFVEPK